MCVVSEDAEHRTFGPRWPEPEHKHFEELPANRLVLAAGRFTASGTKRVMTVHCAPSPVKQSWLYLGYR